MRNGLLGAIVVLTAGASLAWGQYPPPAGPSYPGGPSTIPPRRNAGGRAGAFSSSVARMEGSAASMRPTLTNGAETSKWRVDFTPPQSQYWMAEEEFAGPHRFPCLVS